LSVDNGPFLPHSRTKGANHLAFKGYSADVASHDDKACPQRPHKHFIGSNRVNAIGAGKVTNGRQIEKPVPQTDFRFFNYVN
jgi:hypothetical protein